MVCIAFWSVAVVWGYWNYPFFCESIGGPSSSSWWFQPTWKICWSNWMISPGIGLNITTIWNHRPVLNYTKDPFPPCEKLSLCKASTLKGRVFRWCHFRSDWKGNQDNFSIVEMLLLNWHILKWYHQINIIFFIKRYSLMVSSSIKCYASLFSKCTFIFWNFRIVCSSPETPQIAPCGKCHFGQPKAHWL